MIQNCCFTSPRHPGQKFKIQKVIKYPKKVKGKSSSLTTNDQELGENKSSRLLVQRKFEKNNLIKNISIIQGLM